MAFMEKIHESITFPRGFTAAGVHCGIRKNRTKNDLSLIVCEKLCDAGGGVHHQQGQGRAFICDAGAPARRQGPAP